MSKADPGEPVGRGTKELVLLCGFVVCVVIGLVTVALPELSSGDDEHKPTPAVKQVTGKP